MLLPLHLLGLNLFLEEKKTYGGYIPAILVKSDVKKKDREIEVEIKRLTEKIEEVERIAPVERIAKRVEKVEQRKEALPQIIRDRTRERRLILETLERVRIDLNKEIVRINKEKDEDEAISILLLNL